MDLYAIAHPHFSPDSFRIEALLLWPGFAFLCFTVSPSHYALSQLGVAQNADDWK
jgi:hypothetical protein